VVEDDFCKAVIDCRLEDDVKIVLDGTVTDERGAVCGCLLVKTHIC
jgi:hypothetical protein